MNYDDGLTEPAKNAKNFKQYYTVLLILKC